jgi:hypothetical protein
MSRALLASTLIALLACAAAAKAQDDTLAPPAPEAEPPAPPATGGAEAAPDAEPSAPADPYAAPQTSPRPAPEPAPAPPPSRRYEGQVDGPSGDYERSGYEGGGYNDEYGAPAADRDADEGRGGGFTMPPFSIRIDPFNWLLEGRLGLELEVAVWEFISVELVPVFVANTEPPSFNFAGRDDPISQHSNGLGPISGASLGVGFWLSGAPLRGYVLRAILTDYNYTYEARDRQGVFDEVSHADRRFIVELGSQSRFSAFTIGGGIGLGYELNQAQRCVVNPGTSFVDTATSGCADDDELQIMADRDGTSVADLNGSFHPIYISIRLSLGVSFD